MSYDLIIKNGKVVSGLSSTWINADVGIKDGVIVEVGYLSWKHAETVIDARTVFFLMFNCVVYVLCGCSWSFRSGGV
ncbi:MAG: hypothetical protein QXG04_06990 [Sulfolobales archaeon]